MARRSGLHESRTLTVSVVGLSGTEKEKGATGIGKSCLCNRFLRPLADDYYTEHITVLSQSDFGGRVVNNDHFLYWGDVTKTSDEGQDFTFHVIEQTEFIDDSSFQPVKIGKTEPYYKRCASVKIQSAEKLMYICKNQLGLEHEFEQRLLPDGRLNVDGFLCLFDVSLVPHRELTVLVDHTSLIIQSLLRTKKPVVLVTTKQDEVNDFIYKEAERLVQKFKGAVPMVETSAHKNINVEAAFLTLAQLIDRTKNRPKIVPYAEAARARREVLDVATEAYLSLVRSHVTDYKALWIPIHRRLQNNSDYTHFVELFGTDEARKLFRRHVLQLRDEFVRQKQDVFLRKLEVILRQVLPDLASVADRSWPSIMRWLKSQDFFEHFFVIIPDQLPWRDSDYLESSDERIPFDLLESNEAENKFRDHVNGLRAAQRKAELRKQFEQLLADNHQVCAGKSLSEVAIFFLGRECFSALSEHDKQIIYENHQKELRDRARRDFQELLLEAADWLAAYRHGHVTQEDLRDIDARLQHEPRYRALARLEEDRKVILLNHLGFIQCPSQDKCPARDLCMELTIQAVLANKAHRPQSWSRNSEFVLEHTDKHLNLVLLGTDGLSDQLAREIREQCREDEYTLDGSLYSLDYRTIDGDVSLPQNSLKTADFLPHGCFCVFNSPHTLDYIRCSLEKTLLSDLHRQDQRMPFQGLPIVIVLAHDPEVTEKGLMHLRDQGQDLADRLQCPFIDIPSALMVDASRRFHQDQISLAMHNLVKCIQHRSSLVSPDWQIAESIEPDIRVLMCFMCGDSFSLELPLAPLLNHQCCYVTSDKHPTITLETYLDESKRKVEVILASYHNASNIVQEELYHGYILVYSAKRQASLATLSAFLNQLPTVPTKLLAVTEAGAANAFFSSDHTQSLIMEGNKIADERLAASFMVTCVNFQQQTASYTPFFRECWERKADTQSSFHSFSGRVEEPSMPHTNLFSTFKPQITSTTDRYKTRPPAALPRPPKRKDPGGVVGKSSSNSTEDSEPLYDTPLGFDDANRLSEESDIEDERNSSMSPSPRAGLRGGIVDEEGEEELYSSIQDGEVYSEIMSQETEHLIKPSHVKTKRSMYAEKYRRSYPSASSSFASSSYREESTDTDSSVVRSPQPPPHRQRRLPSQQTLPSRPEPPPGEPHYQFRKSNSMKLALKEGLQGLSARSTLDDVRKRLQKSSTLPFSAKLPDFLSSPPPSHAGYEEIYKDHEGIFHPPPQAHPGTKGKPKIPAKPKPLDLKKGEDMCQAFDRKMTVSGGQQGGQQSLLPVKAPLAPLATPEPVEIPGDYAQVKDVIMNAPVPHENDYASVADALPKGRVHRVRGAASSGRSSQEKERLRPTSDSSDSDSEMSSSLEREQGAKEAEDIYSRVHRRPTPRKTRHNKHASRLSEGNIAKPPLPAYSLERHMIMPGDPVDRVKGYSASEGSGEGTGDEQLSNRVPKKKRSFRSKKKKEADYSASSGIPTTDPAGLFSDSDLMPIVGQEECAYESISGDFSSMRYGEEVEDVDAAGNWRRRLKLTLDGTDKQKRREEKRAKDERRRLKEQQKKKMKKKDSRCAGSTGGWTLEELAQKDDSLVPLFMEKCVAFIEEEGLSTEGLYRVPGNRTHVDQLMEQFKEDPRIDYHSLDIPVNAFATALKQFFSELAEPVVPESLYEELSEISSIPDKVVRLSRWREVLGKLPAANFQVLRFIITHIHKVSEHTSENCMDSKNLAICWWPTLLRPEITSLDTVHLISKPLEEFTQALIDHCQYFFHNRDHQV